MSSFLNLIQIWDFFFENHESTRYYILIDVHMLNLLSISFSKIIRKKILIESHRWKNIVLSYQNSHQYLLITENETLHILILISSYICFSILISSHLNINENVRRSKFFFYIYIYTHVFIYKFSPILTSK